MIVKSRPELKGLLKKETFLENSIRRKHCDGDEFILTHKGNRLSSDESFFTSSQV
jgi:hypothetical protein